MGNTEKYSLNDYLNAFHNFNDYINRLHQDPNNRDKFIEGYFVNLYNYNELIKKVNECLEQRKNPIQNGNNVATNEVNFDKLKTEALKEVAEKIKVDYSFIIINEDLLKVICDKEKQPIHKITYKITTENKLSVQENNLQIQFKNDKNNIISKATILGNIEINDNNNNHNYNNNNQSQVPLNNYESKFYESIKIYIDNEREILTKLNTNSNNIHQGFLVDNVWVEKWKTFSNYNNVSKLLEVNNITEADIKNNIRQELLNKKLDFTDLEYIDKYILKDIKNLKSSETANKTYILLNAKFINLFINNPKDIVNPNTFYLSFHKVEIKINNNIPFLSFQANGNTIFNIPNNISNINSMPAKINPSIIPTNNLYHSQLLKHLIRFPYFKKELKASNHSNNKIPIKVYIINNEIINNLKQKYDLKKVINEYLNNLLNNICYANVDQYYPQISKILNEKYIGYINNIKQLETTGSIQFNENEKKLNFKNLDKHQSKFIYIDNIEIIDENFALFLNQIFNNSLILLLTYYVVIEKKILLIINVNQSFIYEIANFNENGNDIIIEYLIEVKYEPIFQNIDISKYIFDTFVKYGIQKLISMGNTINIGNNIFISFHQVKNNLRNSLNIQNQNNEINKNNYPNNISNLQTQTMNPNPIANQIPQNILHNSYLSKSVAPSFHESFDQMNPIDSSQQPFYLIDSGFYHLLNSNYNIDNNEYKKNNHDDKNLANNYNDVRNLIKVSKFKNTQLYYPINFETIDPFLINKIISIQKTSNNPIKSNLLNLYEEICLKHVNEGFVFRSKKNTNSIFDKNNNLIYLYSDKVKGQPNSKQLIGIFECHNINDRNNQFNLIVNNPNIMNLIKYPDAFANENNLKFHLNIEQTKSNEEVIHINKLPVSHMKSNELNAKTMNPIPTNKRNFENIPIVITDKLKVMILFYISQRYTKENELQKVYLINPDWLKKYETKEIKNFVDNKWDQINRSWNYTYDFNSLSKIIPLFNDSNKLKKLDSKINIEHKYFPLNYPEIVKLIDKYIHFYRKNFILINSKIFALFQTYFGITQTNDDIYYIHTKEGGDIIIIKNSIINLPQGQINTKNLILFGIIDKKENKYNITHIFDYKDKNIIENELQIIKNNSIKNYIYSRTALKSQNSNDISSPIFDDKNQIIGNYYFYKKNFDYTDCNPYYKCLNNELIKNLFDIYRNESYINHRIKSNSNYNNIIDEDFYIIKKEALNDIQIENNYEQLKSFFKGRITNISPSQKDIYMAIKSLEKHQFKDLVNNLNKVNIQTDQKKYEIEIEEIHNPNNQSEIYYIFKDFELVNKNIADSLLNGKYPLHKLKCSFVGNSNIVFHYSINEIKNINYICVISKIDENNNFINEYLLIYKNQSYYLQHFENIKYQLNNFLQSLRFMKGTSPIVINGYIEIGSVFQLTGQNNDLEYFPPIPFDIIDINQDFQSKPLIGFENIGATCYMNATIQCLCNIKKFVEYFKYNKHIKTIVEDDINKEKLCSAFKRLIEYSYPYEFSQNFYNYKMKNPNKKIPIYHDTSKKSYPPENFKETISRLNPLFEGVAANDAKDLVNFLIMTLHEETNTAPPNQVDNNQGNMIMDQTNKMAMFTKFLQNFAQNYRSVISDLFYALNCNITQCGNCQKISYNYQIYFFLNFPLEEVRKYKLQNNNQIMNNNFNNFNNNIVNNIVDIYDCFLYDQKINFMGGENAMYCNYCRQTCGSSMCTLLTSGPKILIIILNRGKGIEFNVKINFYPEINLNNYIEKKDFNWQYELFGVITHIGESGMGGHFIAYCKEFWTNHWLKYNDALVSPVNDFKSEVIDFAMPYLLFYQIKE